MPTGSLLDTLVEVLGENVREALLHQLHANDIPIETAEVEVQTEGAEEGGHDQGGSAGGKDKVAKPGKKRKPLYPGAGNAKAMAYDSGACTNVLKRIVFCVFEVVFVFVLERIRMCMRLRPFM